MNRTYNCRSLVTTPPLRYSFWLPLTLPLSLPFQVTGHKGAEEMATALEDADVVVIPAGVPRKPGMTRYGEKGNESMF